MRYLIVKTSAFGDIIHAYGVIEFLKQQDPSCEVDWVVEKRMSSLVKSHPFVSRCIEVDTKKWRKSLISKATWEDLASVARELRQQKYDAVFDLQGNVKSAIITFLAKACDKVGFGFKTAPEAISSFSYSHRYNPPPKQNIRCDYLFLLESYFKSTQVDVAPQLLVLQEPLPAITGRWLIAPGSNWKNKQTTPETLVAFLACCKEAYNPKFVFLCGTEQELAQAKEFVQKFPESELLYKPSLPVLQHIMSAMELTISMDSLPLHLAATASCPTFSFFGPSSSHKYNPPGKLHGSFQGSCPYGITFERRCPKLRTCPTGACLREVSADTFFSAFQAWYAKEK